MVETLDDLIKVVLETRPEKVKVLDRIDVLSGGARYEHTLSVIVIIDSLEKTERFTFEVGRVVADHELREGTNEDTSEYVKFQELLVSMFQKVKIIERQLSVLKKTELPQLTIEVQV